MLHLEGRSWAVACLAAAVGGCCFSTIAKKPCPSPPATGPTAGAISAGAAVVEVTPAGGASLAGYGGTPRRTINAQTVALAGAALMGICTDPDPANAAVFFEPATGKHDAINARALVLSNTLRKLALVKLDTVGVSRKLRDDIHAAVAGLGIAAEDLVVLGTHTHSGPGGLADEPLWQVAGSDCFSEAVYQQVLLGAVAAIEQAHTALQPAAVGIGTTTQSLASENRRGRPGIYDSEIGVLKVTTSGGAPLAAVFNFAVHGTSLGAANMLFSADCMGEMESVVEAGLPGVIAIFTNGAEGDVSPLHKNVTGMQTEGSLVGNEVVGLWSGIATKPSAVLAGYLLDVEMPAPRYNPAGCPPLPETTQTLCDVFPGLPVAVALSKDWLPATLPFQALRIDDAVFVSVPGEPITEIGWTIKLRAETKGFGHGFVFGLANDHGGYFTTQEEYERGEYEGQSTFYGPQTGEIVVDSADCVMKHVQ